MSTPAEKKLDKLSDRLDTSESDIKKLKETAKPKSVSVTGLTATAAAISASAAASIAASISLFKIDEKGITILGATREFKWLNAQITKLQKKIENEEQKNKRNRDEAVKDNIEDIKRLGIMRGDIEELKTRMSRAAAASRAALDESRRLAADPRNRTDRGIHANRPLVQGVASDVKALERAVSVLSAAFA